MLKYVDVLETFTEIPDEWTLCINIANCPCHCKGCHSQWLWDTYKGDIPSKVLDILEISNLLNHHKGVSCISLMGGDNEPKDIYKLCQEIRIRYPGLKIAWYSGKSEIPDFITNDKLNCFDYIKLGPYIENLGGLDNPKTNQRLFKVCCKFSKKPDIYCLNDITSKFWK